MPDKLRIDKWLWHVRIFKSRSIATAACKAGRIKFNEVSLKPSTLVQIGDVVSVKKEGFNLQFLVKDLITKRVSATLAQPCYENLTSEDELNKYKDWFIGKAAPERREKGSGRPTKKERRELEDYKDNYLNFNFDE